jgi:heme/copper-type cytochrome/quinol oxidase subunit 4
MHEGHGAADDNNDHGGRGSAMLSQLKGVGAFALGVLLLVGITVLALGVISGGAWLAAKIYPIVSVISAMALALSLLVLIPMTLFERTREAGASGLMIASVIFGASLWLWSLVFTYETWGVIAVFIGKFLFGVGIVPVAMLAALVNGLWSILGQLFLGLVLTFGTRFLAAWIAAREDARRHRF